MNNLYTTKLNSTMECITNATRSRGWYGQLRIECNDPITLLNEIRTNFITGKEKNRSCLLTYCKESSGSQYIEMILVDRNAPKMSALKRALPNLEVLVPISSREEIIESILANPEIIETVEHGDVNDNQGNRKDIREINNLINKGLLYNDIIATNPYYSKYRRYIMTMIGERVNNIGIY